MTLEVFFSYDSDDRLLVGRIKDGIENRSDGAVDVYIYEEDRRPGEPIAEKARRQIEQSDLLMVLITPNSQDSPWVHQEIGFADGVGCPVVPVVLAESDVDASEITGLLRGVEYLDYDPQSPEAFFDEFLAFVDRQFDEPSAPTPDDPVGEPPPRTAEPPDAGRHEQPPSAGTDGDRKRGEEPAPDSNRRRTMLKAGAGTVAVGSLGWYLLSETGIVGGGAGGESPPEPTPTLTPPNAGAGEPIDVASVLPLSGQLAEAGAVMEEGVFTAIEDINETGGPLGRPIRHTGLDSEGSPERAVERFTALLDERDLVGVVGAGASGVSHRLVEPCARNGVMLVSPSSTAATLSAATGGDLDPDVATFFGRTAVNIGHGALAAGMAMEQVGDAGTASFLYTATEVDLRHVKLADSAFDGETLTVVPVESGADVEAALEEAYADRPDVIGFFSRPGDARPLLEAKHTENGLFSGAEWVLGPRLAEPNFVEDVGEFVDGMFTVSASAQRAPEFRDAPRFLPHAYDALVLQALAIERAGAAVGEAIADTIQAVSRPPGREIGPREFEKARELLAAGETIDYRGASSAVDLTSNREPAVPFELGRADAGSVEVLDTIPASAFQ